MDLFTRILVTLFCEIKVDFDERIKEICQHGLPQKKYFFLTKNEKFDFRLTVLIKISFLEFIKVLAFEPQILKLLQM